MGATQCPGMTAGQDGSDKNGYVRLTERVHEMTQCSTQCSAFNCTVGSQELKGDEIGEFVDIGFAPEIPLEENAQAGEKELRWINYMAGVMWPYVRKAMMKKADQMFREKMGEELSKHPEVKLTELTLDFDPGMRPPILHRMRVYQRTQQERHAIQIDSDFSFVPKKEAPLSREGSARSQGSLSKTFTKQGSMGGKKDSPKEVNETPVDEPSLERQGTQQEDDDLPFHLRFTIAGLVKGHFPINAKDIGVTDLSMSGTMSCLMAPLLTYEPCVGTGQAFFLDTPSIQMKLVGVQGLGPIASLIRSVLEGVVSNVLAEGFILPHRYVHKLRKDLPLETLINMKSPLPLGVLQVEVLEGKDLPASDTSLMGAKSSDPFVTVKIGYDQVRTSTISNTLDPKWNDPAGHLFVYNVAQIVRITVHDDDVMGQEALGNVLGYNVYAICEECRERPEGIWMDLTDDKGEPAGKLKIRVKYYDVGDLGKMEPAKKPPADAPPYLLTVKLLGLEGPDHGDLRNTRCTIEQVRPAGSEDQMSEAAKAKHHTNRLMDGIERAAKFAATKVRETTGLGFGIREDGVSTKRKSTKAVPWGSGLGWHLEDGNHHAVPPLAIRAMEKLYIQENKSAKEIAEWFQIPEPMVTKAISLRGNFEAVWSEAVHFLQPASDPFCGKIKLKVEAPASNQVRGADDRGWIGDIEIELAPDPGQEDEAHFRRFRKELRRPKAKGAAPQEHARTPRELSKKWKESGKKFLHKKGSKDSMGDSHSPPKSPPKSGSTSSLEETDIRRSTSSIQREETEEHSGLIIEVIVELRPLEIAVCEPDKGQTMRSKEHLVEASLNSGVRITKD